MAKENHQTPVKIDLQAKPYFNATQNPLKTNHLTGITITENEGVISILQINKSIRMRSC